jgi:hypothetical protein
MSAARRHNMAVFLKKYGTDMVAALNNSPIYFSVMLAQACLESGYGTSSAAKNKNNFFGVLSGSTTATFNSAQDAFNHQIAMFQNPSLPYIAGGVLTANSPYNQIRAIANSGYYSMTNDETLGGDNVKKGTVWNGYTWNGRIWVGSNFTPQQSADHYYNNLKGFIDDALFVLPLGKIVSSSTAQADSSIASLVIPPTA